MSNVVKQQIFMPTKLHDFTVPYCIKTVLVSCVCECGAWFDGCVAVQDRARWRRGDASGTQDHRDNR